MSFLPNPMRPWFAAALALASAACGGGGSGDDVSPDFCCTTVESCEAIGADLTPCTDPEAPYCDDAGDFGPRRTCIPEPTSSILMTWPSDGFLVLDGPPEMWWTQTPVTTLRGTVDDSHPITVVVQISGTDYPAEVAGTVWSVDLASGALPATPTDVTVRGSDAAGNTRTITHTLGVDETPPTVGVRADATTTVHDERNDTIDFDASTHRPTHTHVNSDTDAVLGDAAGCPDVYKHITLLDDGTPQYVTETGGASNPVHWAFDVTDAGGVGIDPDGTAYRVRRGAAPDGTYVTDWVPLAGTDATSGQSYAFSLFRNDAAGQSLLPDLDTYEGIFEVELRGRDLFGRETIETRCFTSHPLAPAVEMGPAQPAGDHTNVGIDLRALSAVSLAVANWPVSVQITNANAPGAGLMEFDVWHTAADTAYLTLDLTPPSGANYSMAGQVSWVLQSQASGNPLFSCGSINDDPPAQCLGPALPAFTDPARSNQTVSAAYTVRVFDATGATWTELSTCTGCDATTTRREFALAPATGTAKHYRVIAAINNLSDEFSLAADGTGAQPYSEATLNYIQSGNSSSIQITGKLESAETGCTAFTTPNPNTGLYACTQTKTYRKYRMLKSMSITFTGSSPAVRVTPQTAATASIAPIAATVRMTTPSGVSTSEPTVPTQIP